MQKLYIRAGMSPLEPVPVADAIQRNLFGQNTGNLVYQYSVFRTLMRSDTQFLARSVASILETPGEFERMQEECAFAILPLANAFRNGFNLKQVTRFIERLKIPCAVIGCGLQAKRPEDIREGFPFDEDARAFVKAALDKSALLGLRGEYTAQYLKRLGFQPERHFTVIGCPSLYMNGSAMPAPDPRPIAPDTRFSFNTLTRQPPQLNALIFDTERKHPDYHLVFQEQRELAMLAFGTVNGFRGSGKDATGFYPFTRLHRDVRRKKAVGFTEARSWFDYMKTVDYSFGSRLHGNLAAVVSGTPAFVFTSDTRTEEICRYGNVPHMAVDALKDGADIRDILEKADFGAVCRGYSQRFAHYLDFLNQNGVPHIYGETQTPGAVPFDAAIERLPRTGPVCAGCLPAGTALTNGLRFYSAKLKKRLH